MKIFIANAFIFYLLVSVALAEKLKNDTITLISKEIPENFLKKYRNNPDFDYSEKPPAEDVSADFRRWLNELLEKIFSDEGSIPYIRNTIIVLLLALAVYWVIRSRTASTIINANASKSLKWEEVQTDIEAVDWNAKIQEMLQQKNFRLALRYNYLKLLSLLNSNKIIAYQPDKTNRDYYRELEKTPLSSLFLAITDAYERCWYGNTVIDENYYNEMNTKFQMFQDKIKNDRI